jgi:hypothetical protein
MSHLTFPLWSVYHSLMAQLTCLSGPVRGVHSRSGLMPLTQLPKEEILHVSAHQCHLLAPEHSLTLHLTERIASLLAQPHRVVAQGRFPRDAFRALGLLLLAEEGVGYEVLLTGLYCPDAVWSAVLKDWSLTVPAFQEELNRKQAYLAALKQGAREAEMQQIRRAVKGRAGVAPLLERAGFGWTVQALYKTGYVLRPI